MVNIFLGALSKDRGCDSGLTDQSLQIANPVFTEACTVFDFAGKSPWIGCATGRLGCGIIPFLAGNANLLLG